MADVEHPEWDPSVALLSKIGSHSTNRYRRRVIGCCGIGKDRR